MTQLTNEAIADAVRGQTVATEFLRIATDNADRTSLRWLDGETWNSMTFGEMANWVAAMAGALGDLGVTRGDRVVLMMRNIWQFHIADLAVLMCGGTPVSIYNSSSPEQIAYLVSHCGASLAIIENQSFYARFEPVLNELPALKKFIAVDPSGLGDSVLAWDQLASHDPVDLAEAAKIAQPHDLATIIYTSGTTGNPKGVMLDHENIAWTILSLRASFAMENMEGKRVVSYLPMAHIAERATSHYGNCMNGYEVSCCPEPSQIATYAREVHPNIMFGVPRVWEKVYGGVSAALAADPEKKRQVDEAVAAAIPITEKIAWGTATQEELDTWNFLDAVAFSTIRGLIGLDELDLAVTGAAPIPASLLQWFRAIGVPLAEIYGMSESTGPISFAPYKVKAGSVGPAIPGMELAIADDGEVIFRGGNVFKGYLNDPEKTAETIDDEQWCHTGDIGVLDEDGYLKIVDRKKELIITAGGKNISPANLEAALKTIPLVGQACAIGDNRPFVSALVVLDPEIAPAWAAQHGLGDKSLAELANEPAVIDEINAGLEAAMADFNNAERVKKVTVLGDEWLPDTELLTPTSKLKRRGIHTKFAEEIEAIYN